MRIRRSSHVFLLLGIGSVFALPQAKADLYLITSQSAFTADTKGLVTLSWPESSYPDGTTDYVGNPYSPTANVALASNAWGFTIVNKSSWGFTDVSGNGLLDGGHASLITASFSPAVTAVSETITDVYSTFSATLTLSNNAQYVLSGLPPLPNTTFVGFIATGGLTISSLSFFDTPANGSPNAELDALQYGTANPTFNPGPNLAAVDFVPEPGLYSTLALAMGGLLAFVRRRRSA